MKKHIAKRIIIQLFFSTLVFVLACSNKNEIQKPSGIWDIEKNGIPKFVETNYIELDKIYRISKYRSSVGHDYSDAFEHCRSMKHYFEPRSDIDWSTIKIFSPISGTITRFEYEWAGVKIEIESSDYPAFRFTIFHINSLKQYNLGDKVVAGEQLGTHIGLQTMSDISVIVNDITQQGRMVSYFDVISNSIFSEYLNRGVTNREELIIPKSTRDANSLTCSGDTFVSTDTLENWVILK
jgi:hypothetical protein